MKKKKKIHKAAENLITYDIIIRWFLSCSLQFDYISKPYLKNQTSSLKITENIS